MFDEFVSDCYEVALYLLRRGCNDEAYAFFLFCAKLGSLDPWPQFYLAVLEASKGRYKEAAETLVKVLIKHSEFVPARFLLGKVFQKGMNLPDQAANCFRTVVKLSPNNIAAREHLCFVLGQLGPSARAERLEQIYKIRDLKLAMANKSLPSSPAT